MIARLLPLLLFLTTAAAADVIHVTSLRFSFVIEVDLETGDRREFLVDDYPRILRGGQHAVDPAGGVLFSTADAGQRGGIFRLDPATGAVTGVSGAVYGFEDRFLGTGPLPPASGPRAMVVDGPRLLTIGGGAGLLSIDLATGNRTLLAPPDVLPRADEETSLTMPLATAQDFTTPTIALYQPDDMVLLDAEHVLVADRFEGFVIVPLADTPNRRRLFPPDVTHPATPRSMDVDRRRRRLVYTGLDPDVPAVWQLSLDTLEERLISGAFGGIEAGSGPPIVFAAGILVDPRGRVLVYDSVLPALFHVGEDGHRTIIASDTVGGGALLPDFNNAPTLGTMAHPAPGIRHGWAAR